MELVELIDRVHHELLPQLQIVSLHPHHPVVVQTLPDPWELVGTGNYAAVVAHPLAPGQVIKIYAPGRTGLADEVEVYRRLGKHPAFSHCLYANSQFLILQRLHGLTLYDCVIRGILIEPQVIQDIDAALDYARSLNLSPHDVHGKNVMMHQGRGLVVDVSDFLKPEPCQAWEDLKRAYQRIYLPWLSRLPRGIPSILLDIVRITYRLYRRSRKLLGSKTFTSISPRNHGRNDP